MSISDVIEGAIRERGPLTVAAFMDLALYHPELGYYARAAQRSGRAGDFFTSVDVGPLFGELLEIQVAEMAGLLASPAQPRAPDPGSGRPTEQAEASGFDLVEAGAGNGRLSADILRAARRRDPAVYRQTRLHLSDASARALAAPHATLGDVRDRLVTAGPSLPPSFEGVLLANELLDALPVHQVVMRGGGLREVYVDVHGGRFVTREDEVSTPDLATYFERLGVTLEPGWRAEVNLQAIGWIRDAVRRLRRGFVILIDYGHEARELYSPTHASGTLTTFARHRLAGPEASADTPPWLQQPGDRDITAHVDFTTVRSTAEAEGLTTLGFLDQTYFLLGLVLQDSPSQGGSHRSNVASLDRFGDMAGRDPVSAGDLKQRLALKTLLMPGGLGSTHKVLILGKNIGTPTLQGCSYKLRVT